MLQLAIYGLFLAALALSLAVIADSALKARAAYRALIEERNQE